LIELSFAHLGGASVIVDKSCHVVDHGAPQRICLLKDKVLDPPIEKPVGRLAPRV
jgi:hypothetical protein